MSNEKDQNKKSDALSEFRKNQQIIFSLPTGNGQIYEDASFSSTLYNAEQTKNLDSVKDEDSSVLSSPPELVKKTKEQIETAAVNNYFKMFFDLYMSNENSDMTYRLGKKTDSVLSEKSIQLATNFRTKINVSSKFSRASQSEQYIINYFFPPFNPLEIDEVSAEGVTPYRVWNDSYGRWDYVNSQAESYTSFDNKNLLLSSSNFTYRSNSFKSINDNIMILQQMLEHVTGVVSTYLTEWDISVYMQEGILDSGSDGKPTIGLLYRILQDNPSKYNDYRAFSWGVLNAGISKLSACSGIVNAPKFHFNPAHFPYSKFWTEYDSINRGDGLDIFYDIAKDIPGDLNEIPVRTNIEKTQGLNVLHQNYNNYNFREKIYYWDCKGAAYSGWKNWRDLKYYNTIYTSPEDGLSDIDIIHESESKANLKWNDNKEEKGVVGRVVQALYNSDSSLGFQLQEWKIKRTLDMENEGEFTPSYRYDYYVKNPITGSPSFVASALFNNQDKIIEWYDDKGEEIQEITNTGVLKKFGKFGILLKSPKSLRFYLSKTCKYWPEVGQEFSTICPCENDTVDNFSEANSTVSLVSKEESGGPSSMKSMMSATSESFTEAICNTGVPRWNPFLYGGPHGKDPSPFVVSSMFDENSKILRNLPRIEPSRTDNGNNIGVEKFYNYTTPDMINPIQFPNYGNTRSPYSTRKLLEKGYLNSEFRKQEIWTEYKEFLPFVKKSKIENCKATYYWEPKYKKLGTSYDKKGQDTVSYEGGETIYGWVTEHTGFFSPSSQPTKSNYNKDKIGKGNLWYETAAYEWATYFQYAANDVIYFKGNSRYTRMTYPKNGNGISNPSQLTKQYGVNSISNSGSYGASPAGGNKAGIYGGATPGQNWVNTDYEGTFYELMCTYQAQGKMGTWHRWEVIYVKTPIMYADLSANWHIDEFDSCEYTTSETKKSKIKNTVLAILTLGVSTLFTTRNVTAQKVSSTKKYRLVMGTRTASQFEVNQDSFTFESPEEKVLKDKLFGDSKPGTEEWKKIFLFCSDTDGDAQTKGPKCVFEVFIKKSKYQYITTETSTNVVGCKSSKNTTQKINETEYFEIYNAPSSDSNYYKYMPKIMTAFNEKYFPSGKKVFNLDGKSFDLNTIQENQPGEENILPFINNIFDSHKEIAGVVTNNTRQILRLLNEDEIASQDEAQQEALEGKKFLYNEYEEPENESTYGWGFTTYLPGIDTGIEMPEKFKVKVDLQYKSKIARPNQRDFVYKWWPEELKKIKMYDYDSSYTVWDGEKYIKHNKYKSKLDSHIVDVIAGSTQENKIKNELRWPDANIRKQMGITEGDKYYNSWKDAADRPLSWIFSYGNEIGTKNPTHPSLFKASYDFWTAEDLYGNNFTEAKGYDTYGKAIQEALLGYFSTSTFFIENTETTTTGNDSYKDVSSPCVVSNTIPFLSLYASISTHLAWTEEAKKYLLDAIGNNKSDGVSFKNMMLQIIDERILKDSGIKGKEQKNSLFYNPWIKMAYENAADLKAMENSFDTLIKTLKICKENLEFLNLDAGYSNFSFNEVKTFYNNAKSVQDQLINLEKGEISNLFNYIYSYLNVLYEYRKFFIFKRCNKQNGTLYTVRNFESALPLVENNINDGDIPEYSTDKSNDNSHIYKVAFLKTQNINTERVSAILDKNSSLPKDRISTIYILAEYVDKNDEGLKNYIDYFNDKDGKIPADMQRYVYIPKVDKWVKVPFNDEYTLESSKFLSAKAKIIKNNEIRNYNQSQTSELTKKNYLSVDTGYYKVDENGNLIEPFQPDEFVQNIDWIDITKIDKMYNLIQSVEITDKNKDDYDYNVPYYEFDPGSKHPSLFFGATDGVDIDELIEFEKSGKTSPMEEICATRAAETFWRVYLEGEIPLKRLHGGSIKIVPYSKYTPADNESPKRNPLSGPFSNQLWPIYKDQRAPVPSAFDVGMLDLGVQK